MVKDGDGPVVDVWISRKVNRDYWVGAESHTGTIAPIQMTKRDARSIASQAKSVLNLETP